MANFSSSPGVSLNEIDNSFISPTPVKVGAAVIGPTVKGPVEIPVVVTSYSDYKNRFGGALTSGSDTYSYLTSIAAYNYFNNGGESLLVARVVSSSADYTSATSSLIPNYIDATSSSFALETIAEGVIMNSSGTLNSDGTLVNGTSDNIRWEITNSNTGSGTFNVLIRQGNDKTNDKIILESFNGVSLDPNASNYISKVIGDQVISYNSTENQIDITSGAYSNNSRYVRVKSVTGATPDYFDNSGVAKSSYTASLPENNSGSFGAATGDVKAGANFYENIGAQTQGLEAGNYTNMVNLLSNATDYQFNTLLAPGLLNEHHTSTITSLITNTQNRGDNLLVVDMVDYNGTLPETIAQAQSRNSSYAATYWPWLRIQDPETGKNVWVPASTMIGGVYAYTDKVSAPWFAPAGINRGGLSTVVRAKSKLSQANRDDLYSSNINPIGTFPRKGVVVFGQKTLQKGTSALDRVNVRRLLIELKSFIGQTADNFVFEQNTAINRNKFINSITPYLEAIQQKQGLYAFKVVMDDSLNTPDVIDRNQLIGQIYIQPTRTAEFINLDFIVQRTGAEFPA